MQSRNLLLELKDIAGQIVKEPENISELYETFQFLLKKLRGGDLHSRATYEPQHREWSKFLLSRRTGLAPRAFSITGNLLGCKQYE
jgi:hypothetical protein